MKKLTFTLSLLLLLGYTQPVRAQEDLDSLDPTRTTGAVQDLMRTQVAGLRSVTLRASVVGGENNGVAILQLDEKEVVLVRAHSQCNITVAGKPLMVTVQDVTPTGVSIEAPSLKETIWLASTLGPVRPPRAAPPAKDQNILTHVEFHEVPLSVALRMLAEQGGDNYSSSSQAGQIPVSAFLRHAAVDDVIAELCKTHSLWFRRDSATGILRILTMPEFERDLVSFREEETEVFTLLYPNVLELASVVQSLYGDRVLLTFGNERLTDDSNEIAQRFRRFDMIDQRGGSFGSTSSRRSGGSGYGGGTGEYGSGLGSTTTLLTGRGGGVWQSGGQQSFQNLTAEQAARLAPALDTAGSTNAVGTSAAALRERNASILVTISRRNNMLIVRTSDPSAMEDIRALVRRMDVPTPMVLLEVKVLSVALGDGFNSVFDLQFHRDGTINRKPSAFTGGFTSGDVVAPAPGSFAPGGTGLRSGDMTFQIVSEHFTARIQMLEERNRAKVLATPMLLTANNEVSRLFIGEERPIITGVTSDTILTESTSVTTPRTQWESREIGTTLLITPNINSDRTVTLRLVQEDSSIKPDKATIPVVLSGGDIEPIEIDVVASRVISGTFVAKDQLTVAVGGLIEEQESVVRSQVPILGRIPLLGLLFRRESRQTTRNETVILIRPQVINTPSEGEEISRRLLRNLAVDPVATEGRYSLDLFRKEREKQQEKELKAKEREQLEQESLEQLESEDLDTP